jgi:chromosomal replication initiation ATPase DnaA
MQLPTKDDLILFKTRELFRLRKDLLIEIDSRLGIQKTKREKQADIMNYSLGLLSFITKELDIDLNSKSRKRDNVCLRFSVFEHLRSKELSLTKIGLLFNRDHASVIHGLQKFKDYYEQKDNYFLIQHNKILSLIDRYNNTI